VVLLSALRQTDLAARVVEALPWLALHYADSSQGWLVERARVHNVQNRLGYVVTLAADFASAAHPKLVKLAQELEASRLAREDTLCHDSMTETERRWLREQRPAQAEHWNLLTDLRREHLPYAA